MLSRHRITRRNLISGTSALGAGLIGASAIPAFAKAPMLHNKAPAFYRFAIGDLEATVIFDGPLNFTSKIFRGAPEAEIKQLLADDYVQPDAVRMEQNI